MHSGTVADEAEFALELAARQWWIAHQPGLAARGGMFAALCVYFDHLLESLALRRGAVPHAYPSLISQDILKRLEYFDSFPGVATLAGDLHAISPAVCYHTYQALQGRLLSERPYRITAAGPCARWESGRMTTSAERLWCFNMREMVFFGSSDEVARECRTLRNSLRRAFAKAGVQTAIVEAADPFFGGASRGKLVLQKLKRLKVELRAALPQGKTMAIASVNDHETFFAQRMAIGFADATPARSGCVAIGLERCAYAFLLSNGLQPGTWPGGVLRFLARRKYHAVG